MDSVICYVFIEITYWFLFIFVFLRYTLKKLYVEYNFPVGTNELSGREF